MSLKFIETHYLNVITDLFRDSGCKILKQVNGDTWADGHFCI